jgi:flagellar biogenesis protein FliO
VPLEPSERSSPGAQNSRAGSLPSLLYTGGSIVLVLGLFFIVAWAMRRAAPRGSILLPGEVVELLGQAPLASRQRVHLLRLGNKLLLVSVTTNGTETLGEITDPEEVDRLAGLCRQAHPKSVTTAFRQVFDQFNREPRMPELPDRDAGRPLDAGIAGRRT